MHVLQGGRASYNCEFIARSRRHKSSLHEPSQLSLRRYCKVAFPFVINHHFTNVSESHKSCRGFVVVDLRLSVLSFVKSKLHRGGKIITAFRTRQPASPNSYPISSDPVVMANLQHSSYPSIHTFSGIQTARLVELRIQIVNCIHDVPSQRGMYAFWVQVLFLPAQQ